MTRTRSITSALLLAIAAVNCSNTPDTPAVSVAATAVSPPRPVPGPSDSVSAPQRSDDEASARVTAETPPSFSEGEAAYHAKRYEEAIAIFEAYVSRRPQNAWGHYMLALSTWKTGDLTRSEQAFEQTLRIDPRHIKSYVNLGRVLTAQGRHDDAIERLTHAADIDPDSLEVHRLLGRTYHLHGKTAEAEHAYRRALEVNARDAWSLNYLGLVLIETDRPDEALPLLIQAVQLRKDVAEFHNNLGLALEHAGHVNAAATAYGSALRVDPSYDAAKQNLARVEPQE
jgi:tetratricopeptide (TPR) repeat protein